MARVLRRESGARVTDADIVARLRAALQPFIVCDDAHTATVAAEVMDWEQFDQTGDELGQAAKQFCWIARDILRPSP